VKNGNDGRGFTDSGGEEYDSHIPPHHVVSPHDTQWKRYGVARTPTMNEMRLTILTVGEPALSQQNMIE